MFKGCRVGVVVPAYNEERQIESVLETMPDFVDRVFVVDDCSRVPVQELLGSPPGVTFIRLPRNGGLAAAGLGL